MITMLDYPERPTVLVVDDTPENLSMMSHLLKEDYKVKVANNGEKALRIAASETSPDLILLDVMMPDMDGYEVCRRLKADPRTFDIPVIFLTAKSEVEDETMGLELGAVDYITKPISPPIVKVRVKAQLTLKSTATFLRDKNLFLEEEVERRTRELHSIQHVSIMALSSLAETRDNDTGNHIRRTQFYVLVLAKYLKDHPAYSRHLADATITTLVRSAPLHDIGKVGIPDRILLKPGRLEQDEFEIMKTHTTLGREAIQRAEDHLGISVDFLACAKEIAYSHHEKWDGTGYPDGLAGDAIPVSARLMAIADVYDALISQRIYKPAMLHHQAVEIIAAGRGTHFDPEIVDAFLVTQDKFAAIARHYQDGQVRSRQDAGESAALPPSIGILP